MSASKAYTHRLFPGRKVARYIGAIVHTLAAFSQLLRSPKEVARWASQLIFVNDNKNDNQALARQKWYVRNGSTCDYFEARDEDPGAISFQQNDSVSKTT